MDTIEDDESPPPPFSPEKLGSPVKSKRDMRTISSLNLAGSPEKETEEDGYATPPPLSQEERKRKKAQRDALEKEERARRRRLKKHQLEALQAKRTEQNELVASKQKLRGEQRFRFLLNQTEVFSHFISPKKAARSSRSAPTKGRRRGRVSEREEDQELLQDEEDSVMTTRLTVQPGCIQGGVMRDYQLLGLNWLIRLWDNGLNGILADEMGLGKTLQSISLLGYLKEFRGIEGPHMVVVPKSTLGNWMREFQRWCPTLTCIRFHGDKEERAHLIKERLRAGKFNVCVTTYEMAILENAALRKFNWMCLVIDEAHRIKASFRKLKKRRKLQNEESKLSLKIRILNSQYRLLLTGTPLQNNLHELWALLNYLLPDVFGNSEAFDDFFKVMRINKSNKNKQLAEDSGDVRSNVVEQLHKVLRPFMLRRLKRDVEKSIPPKKETKLFVGLSDMQREWYTKILSKDIDAINSISHRGERMRLLNVVMQLRKCCNHPYLFDGAEPGPPFTTDEHLVTNSGKMIVLDKLLKRLKENGNRVLIFSQMTRVLDILEDYMEFRGYPFVRIDGQTKGTDRDDSMLRFNAPNSDLFCFLLSTRAGGLGINLETADTVILYDSDWNPQMDLQAQDRAHRIGQKKVVNVYRLVTDQTIEEKIVLRAEMKLHLDALVIQQGRLAEKNPKATTEELVKMIKFGADRIFKSKESMITDEDIELILSRGETKTVEQGGKLKEASQRNLLKFSGDEEVNLYDFDGVDYSEQQQIGQHLVQDRFLSLPSRQRKKVSYKINQYYQEALGGGPPKKKKPSARLPNQPSTRDWHLYPRKIKWLNMKEQIPVLIKMGISLSTLDEEEEEEAEEAKKEEQETKKTESHKSQRNSKAVLEQEFGPMGVDGLTEEEVEERKQLMEHGFPTWSRRDMQAFLRACEASGRENIYEIVQDMVEYGAGEEESKRYHNTFLERWEGLDDFAKYKTQIERGEAKLQRLEQHERVLKEKVAMYENPMEDLKYGARRISKFTEEEDRFIICAMAELGYGKWEGLCAAICDSSRFSTDWFLRSRTPFELMQHLDGLLRSMARKERQKEAEEAAKAKLQEERKVLVQALEAQRLKAAEARVEADAAVAIAEHFKKVAPKAPVRRKRLVEELNGSNEKSKKEEVDAPHKRMKEEVDAPHKRKKEEVDAPNKKIKV